MATSCSTCGEKHLTQHGNPSCTGHVTHDRESYVKGQNRKKLPKPRPCRCAPMYGLSVCASHGGQAQQVKAAGQRREAEAKARAAVDSLGAAGDPVTDPIGKLCAIAGRAVAFMEALGARVDQLEDGTATDQARADIAVYGRSIKDAAGVVESIIRMGIAERLAKHSAEQTAAIVAFFDAVLTDLGHNPRDPEVAGVIARRLELVA